MSIRGETSPAELSMSRAPSADWRSAALGMLSIRIVQGFIYWGGGSRRLIYDPEKLDPHAHEWMANKLQAAMPGSIFWTEDAISFLLRHAELLYPTLIAFSVAEFVVGGLLIFGLMTRGAAAASLGFSVMLMILFGWQGAVCIEGWTMAACGIAMGAALMVNGSGAYALDNVFLRRRPGLSGNPWFRWLGGTLPLPRPTGDRLAIALFVITFGFIVVLYDYYRGSLLSAYHDGPVSSSVPDYTLSAAMVSDRAVRIHLYYDAGTPEAPSFIMSARLSDASGSALATWTGEQLRSLSADCILNEYAYNQIETGPHGLVATMGAKAWVTLPLSSGGPPEDTALFTFTTVDGREFSTSATSVDDIAEHGECWSGF